MFDVKPSLDGHYSICVWNAEDLSDDQIQETFSKFGEISNINRAKGIVFIRFREKDHAISCLESMQRHPKYTVRPAKEKKSAQDNETFRSQYPKHSEKMTSPGYGKRNDEGNFSKGRISDGYPEKMTSPGYGKRNDEGNFSKGRNSDGYPAKRDNRDVGRRDDEGIPPMPGLVKINAPEPPIDPNTPKAKIVVIANLPTGFKQCNVYKLCSANKTAVLQPLHIAMKKINRPPEPEIRLAYVYYKTDEEVNVAVEFLNNLPVNGSTLVVYTVDKLLEESGV